MFLLAARDCLVQCPFLGSWKLAGSIFSAPAEIKKFPFSRKIRSSPHSARGTKRRRGGRRQRGERGLRRRRGSRPSGGRKGPRRARRSGGRQPLH